MFVARNATAKPSHFEVIAIAPLHVWKSDNDRPPSSRILLYVFFLILCRTFCNCFAVDHDPEFMLYTPHANHVLTISLPAVLLAPGLLLCSTSFNLSLSPALVWLDTPITRQGCQCIFFVKLQASLLSDFRILPLRGKMTQAESDEGPSRCLPVLV